MPKTGAPYGQKRRSHARQSAAREGNARMPSSLSLEGRSVARALFRAERSTNPPTAARKPIRQRWRHGEDLSPTPASRGGRRLMNGLLQNAGSGSEAMTPRRDGAGIKNRRRASQQTGCRRGPPNAKAQKGPLPLRPEGSRAVCVVFKRRPTSDSRRARLKGVNEARKPECA